MLNRRTLIGVIGLVLVTIAAFAPAVRGPFQFDDTTAIQGNPTITALWPISVPLHPPAANPLTGRPVANLSLALDVALNNALGIDQRDDPDGPDKTIAYHVTNLAIHIACGLLLLGIIRRTLRSGRFTEEWSDRGDDIALLVAALWLLHPLQTEAVDYLTQRTELLVSLCYLATLYASIRICSALTRRARVGWFVIAVLACLLGMGSKEVMVSAPLMVVLYDRAFRFSSWSEWRKRRKLYGALFCTLLLLAALIAGSTRGGTAGFNYGIPWYEYLQSQGWAITHYLGLVFWPAALAFDYGPYAIPHWRGVPGLFLLALLFGITCAMWARVNRWGWIAFLGAWFFLILAPSSSILTVATEIAAERRMYLALAAVLTLLVVVGIMASNRLGIPARLVSTFAIGLPVVLAILTFERSRLYQSPEALWRDAVAKVPGNARAWNNLGVIVGNLPEPRLSEADSFYRVAVALDPRYLNAMNNLAITAIQRGQDAEAEQWYRQILSLKPGHGAALAGLGNLLLRRGDTAAAKPLLDRLVPKP